MKIVQGGMNFLRSVPLIGYEVEVEVGLYAQNELYQSTPVQIFQAPEIKFVWKYKFSIYDLNKALEI